MKKQLPIVGLVAVALAFVVVLWAFALENLSEDRRWLVTLAFAVFVGIAAGCFTGSMEVKYSSPVGFTVAAAGGFGAWFLTPFIFPAPSGMQVNVALVREDKVAVQERFAIKYERGRLGVGSEEGVGGKVTLNDIPAGARTLVVTSFTSPGVEIESTKKNGVWEFPIESDGRVRLNVRNRIVSPVSPGDFPDVSVFESLPSAEVVGRAAEIEPKKITLMYRNATQKPLHLWLFDCSRHYRNQPNKANESPPWLDFKILPPGEEYAEFHNFFDTTGWYCFAVEDDKGIPHSLKCKNLCDKQVNKLTIRLDSERGYVADWE